MSAARKLPTAADDAGGPRTLRDWVAFRVFRQNLARGFGAKISAEDAFDSAEAFMAARRRRRTEARS